MMKAAFLALVLAAMAPLPAMAAATTTAAPTAADQRLKAIYDAEWTWRLTEFANVMEGLRTKNGDHFPGVTPADWERRKAYWQRAMAAMAAIPDADLSPEEQLNKAVLTESLRAQVANIGWRTYEAPLNSDSFFWGEVKQIGRAHV